VGVKRWVWIVTLLVGAAIAVVSLRERVPPPAVEAEIDDASKEALREILRQEEE
jgi:hypothetical protein